MPRTSQSGPPIEDRQPEAPERRAQNPAHLDVVEGEEALDVAHDVAPDGKRHGGGDERDAAGEEEALSVHGVTIIYEPCPSQPRRRLTATSPSARC